MNLLLQGPGFSYKMSVLMEKSMSPPPTPKKPRKSIKLDRVAAHDYLHLNMMYACEQCTHYDPESDTCTIGYQPYLHKKAAQDRRFEVTSHMAFCRFMEID